jgi:ParB family chromosome partitioning protein
VQKTKRSGLPSTVAMKHDGHFVDLISSRSLGPRIRMIPIEKIDPNPHQARCQLGNIEELQDSIRSKGILEPILVRAKGSRFEIIAGERRFMASRNIGLKELPCIDMDVEDAEAMEIALIENLQRKDLDIFEEADGLQALADIHSYNHEQIAAKIGKARSTITEILSIAHIPQKARQRSSNITSTTSSPRTTTSSGCGSSSRSRRSRSRRSSPCCRRSSIRSGRRTKRRPSRAREPA